MYVLVLLLCSCYFLIHYLPRFLTQECLSVIYRDSSLPRDSNADEALISHLQGFSKVIRLLMDAQKPLVGHNCFLDILKIYHHFLDPLPETYPEFKERIRGNFPAVWDTKHMAFDILRRLEKENSPLSGM